MIKNIGEKFHRSFHGDSKRRVFCQTQVGVQTQVGGGGGGGGVLGGGGGGGRNFCLKMREKSSFKKNLSPAESNFRRTV